MNITINVTQDHIEQGTRGNTHSCAIALAAYDAIGPLNSRFHLSSFEDLVIYEAYSGQVFLSEPYHDGIMNWVSDFDSAVPVSPFSFSVEIPDDILEKIRA